MVSHQEGLALYDTPPLIPQIRPTTSRAVKDVSPLQAARLKQYHFLEVDHPEVQLQGLANPMNISVTSSRFWADTGSLLFTCSGAFFPASSLERSFPLKPRLQRSWYPYCVLSSKDLVVTKPDKASRQRRYLPYVSRLTRLQHDY